MEKVYLVTLVVPVSYQVELSAKSVEDLKNYHDNKELLPLNTQYRIEEIRRNTGNPDFGTIVDKHVEILEVVDPDEVMSL